MAGAGRLRSDWNQALIEEGIATAYAKVLVAATASMQPAAFYTLWPHTLPAEPWGLLVRALYTALVHLPVLHMPAVETEAAVGLGSESSGRWVTPSSAILPTDELRTNAPLTNALRSEGVAVAYGLPAPIVALFHLVRSLTPLCWSRLRCFHCERSVTKPPGLFG
jgi:sacsin